MAFATCPELDLDEWGGSLLASLQGRRYPLDGTLELTERCNLGCVHCYINQPAGSLSAQARELSASQIAGIVDQIADAGCLFVLLTGGEVLLRPDFGEIYSHVRQRGMIATVFTNGTLLTPQLADTLAESRPFSIEVTLYGATAATYEAVTGVPGSYARCRRGIELLLERGLSVGLKSVLLKENRHELEPMQALAKQLGAKYRYEAVVWPRLDGGLGPLDHALPVSEVAALDRDDPERLAQWEKVAAQFTGEAVRAEYVYSCGAGLHSFHIDSAGRLSLCMMARRPAYDLSQMSFIEGWNRLGAERLRRRELETPCRSCTVGGLCAQCPGWSQAMHGDDETPVDFVCELGHMRAAQIQRVSL